MADTKISALTAVTAPAATDEFAVNQGGTSKRMTLAQVRNVDWIDVTDHGAVGNGVADDSTAISNARTAAGAGTIYFPPGTYLSGQIALSTAGQVLLLAAGATLKCKNTVNTDFLNITAADVQVIGNGWTSIIDGNKANQTGGAAFYLNGSGAARTHIANLTVQNSYGQASIVINGASDAHIERVKSTAPNGHGIFGYNNSLRCLVERCVVTGGPTTGAYHGITFHSTTGGAAISGTRVVGNYVEIGATDGFGIELGQFSGDRPSHCFVTDNVVKATAQCDGGISFAEMDMSTMSDNLFDAAGYTIDNSGFELANADDTICANNHAANMQTCRLPISVDMSSRCVVEGNYIEGWRTADPAAAIWIGQSGTQGPASDNVIASNMIIQVNATTEPAVHLQANASGAAVDRNLITGNKIKGNDTASTQGINLEVNTGTVADTLIIGNSLHNLGVGVTVGASVTGTQMTGNRLVACDTAFSGSGLATASGRAVAFLIDGGGAAITTGVKGDLELPFSGYILAATTMADQSGSIVVDIWKDTYANYPPTDADSITASAPPTLSTAVKAQDATLTGWTRTFTKGDVLRWNVDSATTVTRVTISLLCVETG